MTVLTYPLRSEWWGYPNGAPFLPLRIINPNNGLRIHEWGLVDTGAGTTYIPRRVADNLKHEFEKGQPAQGPTAGGQAQVHLHTFEIDVLGIDAQGNVAEGDVRINIPRQLIPVGENVPVILLGVKELLCKCVLRVDYPHQTFSIEIQEESQQAKCMGAEQARQQSALR